MDDRATSAGVLEESTGRASRPRMAGAIGWSAFAVVGRQASQMAFALVLAMLLGPEKFGIVSAATVYVRLTTMVLDQGLSSALIQRPRLEPNMAGAVATFNLATGSVLAAMTWAAAPLVADFFNAAELTALIRVLGLGLMLKAVAINPRAMLMRDLRFGMIAASDVIGGVAGMVAGIVAALRGAEYWALAWQVGVTDAVLALILLASRQGGKPNLHFRGVVALLPFSLRIFGANALAYLSRNSDNILVGRYLGVAQLSPYSLAYRALSLPVQFVGQTLNRVTFPALSRMAAERSPLGPTVLRVTELLTICAVPPMAYVAIAAPELVHVVLGPEWSDVIPVLTILALAGARETVLAVTHSLMRALGRGRLILWYEVGASMCQVTGIAIGLMWGIVGVATGFLIAGLVLTPVLLTIQRRLAGVSFVDQLATVGPVLHAVAWATAAYALVRAAGLNDVTTVLIGLIAYVAAGALVLRIAHRQIFARLIRLDFLREIGSKQ